MPAYSLLLVGVLGIPVAAALGERTGQPTAPDAVERLVAASQIDEGTIVVVQHACPTCRTVLDHLANLSAGGLLDRVLIAELPPYAPAQEARFLFPDNVRRMHCPDDLNVPCVPNVISVINGKAREFRCLAAGDVLSL